MNKNKRIQMFILLLGILVAPLLAGENENLHNYWIFFSDKEVADPASFDPADHDFPQLTQRAIERRQLRGVINGPSYLDLDVSQTYIDSVLVEGMEIRTVSRWLNAISVSAPGDLMEGLEDRPEIRKVSRIRKASKKMVKKISRSAEEGLESNTDYGGSMRQNAQINAVAAHDSGFTGDGVLVLVLDTGFMTDHETFQAERIIAEYDFVQNDSVTSNQEGDHPAQHNHGTHVSSVIGGNAEGAMVGVAFECNFLLAKTEIQDQEIQVEEDQYVAGLEWGEALGADLCNSSLGYNDWYEYEDMDGNTATTSKGVDIATSLGMLCVTSMGNEGNTSWYYMLAPADADSVIAVGAVDSLGNIAGFSSHGPSFDGRTKPEVVGPGVQTFSAGTDANDHYILATGTSLSAPMVAGAAALVLEAHPDWSPMMVREALMMTANRANSPDNSYGFGLIDVMAAIEYDIELVPGDLNGDQLLTISDAVLAIEWLINNEMLTAAELDAVDTTDDGEFNISDIVVLIEWLMTL